MYRGDYHAKNYTYLGFIGVILAAIVTLWKDLRGLVGQFTLSFWGIVFTVFALVISALSGFLAYRVQTYDTAPSPRRLMEKYLTWAPSHVKYVVLYQIVHILAQNEKLSTESFAGSRLPSIC